MRCLPAHPTLRAHPAPPSPTRCRCRHHLGTGVTQRSWTSSPVLGGAALPVDVGQTGGTAQPREDGAPGSRGGCQEEASPALPPVEPASGTAGPAVREQTAINPTPRASCQAPLARGVALCRRDDEPSWAGTGRRNEVGGGMAGAAGGVCVGTAPMAGVTLGCCWGVALGAGGTPRRGSCGGERQVGRGLSPTALPPRWEGGHLCPGQGRWVAIGDVGAFTWSPPPLQRCPPRHGHLLTTHPPNLSPPAG